MAKAAWLSGQVAEGRPAGVCSKAGGGGGRWRRARPRRPVSPPLPCSASPCTCQRWSWWQSAQQQSAATSVQPYRLRTRQPDGRPARSWSASSTVRGSPLDTTSCSRRPGPTHPGPPTLAPLLAPCCPPWLVPPVAGGGQWKPRHAASSHPWATWCGPCSAAHCLRIPACWLRSCTCWAPVVHLCLLFVSLATSALAPLASASGPGSSCSREGTDT
ncbi:hypothetical protein V8C86DRAFT_2616143 [Haematococcus lacustris]